MQRYLNRSTNTAHLENRVDLYFIAIVKGYRQARAFKTGHVDKKMAISEGKGCPRNLARRICPFGPHRLVIDSE